MINSSSRILSPFVREPWKKFTFREIKLLTKSKSESYVYGILKEFVESDALKQEKVGNVIQYSLAFSQKSIFYVSVAAERLAMEKKLPFGEINALQEKMPSKLYTLVITGSYASGKQTAKSDLDLVIICDNPKKVYSELRHYCDMSIPKIHLYAFTEKEFAEMLLNRNANYGKEIVKNSLVITGAESYYRILQEAIKNGFNG
jgi:ribosomal protein L30E